MEIQVIESILLVVLLVAALFIIVAVLLQKSSDDGLSGSITGGSDTFYGKDKSSHGDRTLFIFTIIVAIIFVLAVLAVYILQPDFYATYDLDAWKTSNFLPQRYQEIFTAK